MKSRCGVHFNFEKNQKREALRGTKQSRFLGMGNGELGMAKGSRFLQFCILAKIRCSHKQSLK